MPGFITVLSSDFRPANNCIPPEMIEQVYDQAFALASQTLNIGLAVGLFCGVVLGIVVMNVYTKYQERE